MASWGRVLERFVAPENEAYLGGEAGSGGEALREALRAFARGEALRAEANPTARRRPRGLWEEVRRLNRAFLAHYAAAEAAEPPEPYHLRAFAADSLAPAGLGGLNARGVPPYALAGEAPFDPAWGAGDAPWGPGDAGRSAAEAAAEYWGESRAASGVGAGHPGRALEGGWGGAGAGGGGAGGSRFMRREAIPFWQKGGREGTERGIGETLPAAREHDGLARGWGDPRRR